MLAGLTLFGMDFFNESWNGWVLALTGRSAVWTAPGDTALRTMVGWNIEIMFMFALAGLVYYHTLGRPERKRSSASTTAGSGPPATPRSASSSRSSSTSAAC
ncbi:MAG: hypothetical protein MZV70_29560 [Desulfobacterales bacterium]|nr:hypothetical protein [Desulfobacterales bacterium]